MKSSPVLIKSNNKIIEILCELATTPQEISKGLMGRHILLQDDGMAFLFPHTTQSSFWMLNTLIPLSIAFFDDLGKILDIQDMQPNTIEPHSPPSAFRGALEMNQGWFDKHNIKEGDIITIPSSSYPLMLNEEVYYDGHFAKSTHGGIELLEDFDEPESFLIPWSEVDDSLINKTYPRFIINDNISQLNTYVKQSSGKSRIKTKGLAGTDALIAKYGEDKVRSLDAAAKSTMGIDLKSGTENTVNLVKEITKTWEPSQITRGAKWYDDEFQGVIRRAQDSLGIHPEIMAAVIAVQSPRSRWFSTSAKSPHGSNQQHPLKQALVMKQLESGLYVPEDITAQFSDKKRITIPAGTQDLDSLSDEQVAILSRLGKSTSILPTNQLKAIRVLRKQFNGESMDVETEIPWFSSPKANSFFHAGVHTADECATKGCPNYPFNYAIETHMFGVIGNQYVRGSNLTSFKKTVEQFIKQKGKPERPGYDYASAILENARSVARENDIINLNQHEFQALPWSAQILRSGTKNERKMTRDFLDSPRDKLFLPFNDHESENELEERLHEILAK